MDLKEVLKRTKPRSEKITVMRKPPSIATADRPYTVEENIKDLSFNAKSQIETVSNEPLAMREQTVSNALAIREQIVSNALAEPAKQKQQPLAEPLAKPLAKRKQTVSNALANEVEKLFGKEKQLLLFLFQKCQIIGSLETSFITTEELKSILMVKANHLRNIIFRLVDKGFIEILETKNGKSSCRKFRMPKEIFQSFTLDVTVSNALAMREQNVSKALAAPLAEALASHSSSSFLNDLNTTTTEPPRYEKFNLTYDWKNININPLENIGFTTTHLEQIASQKILTPEIVQDSIHAFAFDLTENDKAKSIKSQPLNFFMGVLRNGKPYAPPGNYESPKDRAMREYVEKKQAIEKKRVEFEAQALEFSFREWFENLVDEEKRKFCPKLMKYYPEHPAVLANAKKHFSAEIWEKKQEDIINQSLDITDNIDKA